MSRNEIPGSFILKLHFNEKGVEQIPVARIANNREWKRTTSYVSLARISKALFEYLVQVIKFIYIKIKHKPDPYNEQSSHQ